MRGARWGIIALGIALATASGARADPRPDEIALVVADAWRGPTALDEPTLRRIYLGRQTRIEGRRVQPLHLPLGHPVREGFSRTLLRRSSAALERYWIEQALLGGALPPRELSGADAVLRAVRARPGAIGYVAAADLPHGVPDGVRVLGLRSDGAVLRPGDADYPLRMEAASRR